jgi:hypothetical protein
LLPFFTSAEAKLQLPEFSDSVPKLTWSAGRRRWRSLLKNFDERSTDSRKWRVLDRDGCGA